MGSHWFLATIIGFLFFLSVVSTTEKRYDSFVEQAEAECEQVWIGPESIYSDDNMITDFCVIEVGDGE